MKNLFNILLFILSIATSVIAQEKESNPFQASFLYPLGSNGVNTQTINNTSFNVLWGINGGVNYFELGGIANVNNGDVHGGQIAGITNVTRGTSSGFVIAGVTNYADSTTTGFHIAGVNNFSNGETTGAQISGIANVSNGNMNGAQIGLTNTVRGNLKGTQIGLINYTDSLKGAQIGLINVVSKGAEGTPIGLINVVKDGYYAIEIVADATIMANLNFKMGTERFYTIFKGGYTQYNQKDVYSFGAGFGTLIPLAKRVNLGIDLSTNQLIYDGNYDEMDLNLLSKADLNVHFKIIDHLSIFAGPSLNVYTTNYQIAGMETVGSLDIPEHAFYDDITREGYRTALWIGGQAGLNISF